MSTLRRKIPVSGFGSQIPVRVEDAATGAGIAFTTAGRDGSYAVQVPPGVYRVVEKWGAAFDVDVPADGSFDVGELAGGDATTESQDGPRVEQAVVEASAAPVVSDAGSVRPGRVPRDGGRDRTSGVT